MNFLGFSLRLLHFRLEFSNEFGVGKLFQLSDLRLKLLTTSTASVLTEGQVIVGPWLELPDSLQPRFG